MDQTIILKQLTPKDKYLFAKWWRDKDLIALTSGNTKPITKDQIEKYFFDMLHSQEDLNFIIMLNSQPVGHVSLNKRPNNWYETQIIIGEKEHWGKGYGTQAIEQILKEASKRKLDKIYLEVRPTNKRAIKAYQKAGFIRDGLCNYPNNPYLPKTLKMILSARQEY